MYTVLVQAGPPRINDLVVYRTTDKEADLSWTAPIPAVGNSLLELDVRLSTMPINALNFASQTRCTLLTSPGSPGTVQNAIVSGLQPGITYYFALKYLDQSGWSSPSPPANGTTSITTNASVTLAWNPSVDADAAGYKIYYGITSGNYTNSVLVGNVTSYTVTGLIHGVTYYFTVTMYTVNYDYYSGGNWATESGFSNEVIDQVP